MEFTLAQVAEYNSRGLAAMCRAPGQFSMLLDEDFTILWHTESLQGVIGFDSVAGLNGIDFVHPDDVGVVLHLLSQLEQLPPEMDGPAFHPGPADLRLRTSSEAWVAVQATVFDQIHDPWIKGLFITCVETVDRSDMARSIELLGRGRPVDDVLPLIARFGDRTMGGDSRCVITWWDDGEVRSACSADAAMPDARMEAVAESALRTGLRDAVTVTDFNDVLLRDVGPSGSDLGFSVVTFVPIFSPNGDEIVGCFVGWGHQQVEFFMHPQMPLNVGLRIAALAIMDGRTKRDLRWAAAHDPLTLLINRAEFSRRLEAMDGTDVLLMYIDLDDFKPINDLHGHAVGDAVLVEVAARIRETVGLAGVVCRLGGDEFAVACGGTSDVIAGWELAKRVVEAVRQPIGADGETVAVGASVGVAIGVHPLIPAILLERADEALREAKNAGKNTVKLAA